MKSAYFRMSVTDRCNFNCYFCHNEGQPKTITANTPEFLTPADYGWISKLAFDYGFRKFKITGGEPTLRQDLSEIISQIKAAGVQDLSMITNGARLKFVSAMLKKAGLGRVNVSLYSLNPKTFVRNQRVSSRFVSEVREGIDAAIACGFGDIKLNYIVHNAHITDDFEEVIDFAGKRGLTLVLLPLLPISLSTQDETVSLSDLRKMLIGHEILQEDTIVDQEGIRKRLLYLSNGAKVLLRSDELAWMEPYNACITCDQYHLCREGIFPIRLSARGHLAPCLAGGKDFVDILPAIKFRDHAMILDVFESAIA